MVMIEPITGHQNVSLMVADGRCTLQMKKPTSKDKCYQERLKKMSDRAD